MGASQSTKDSKKVRHKMAEIGTARELSPLRGNAHKLQFMWDYANEYESTIAALATKLNIQMGTIQLDKPEFAAEYLKQQRKLVRKFRADLNLWMQRNQVPRALSYVLSNGTGPNENFPLPPGSFRVKTLEKGEPHFMYLLPQQRAEEPTAPPNPSRHYPVLDSEDSE